MSELELIYWFLDKHGAYIKRSQDGGYIASAFPTQVSPVRELAYGETIGDAIRQWRDEYETKAEAKP